MFVGAAVACSREHIESLTNNSNGNWPGALRDIRPPFPPPCPLSQLRVFEMLPLAASVAEWRGEGGHTDSVEDYKHANCRASCRRTTPTRSIRDQGLNFLLSPPPPLVIFERRRDCSPSSLSSVIQQSANLDKCRIRGRINRNLRIFEFSNERVFLNVVHFISKSILMFQFHYCLMFQYWYFLLLLLYLFQNLLLYL